MLSKFLFDIELSHNIWKEVFFNKLSLIILSLATHELPKEYLPILDYTFNPFPTTLKNALNFSLITLKS